MICNIEDLYHRFKGDFFGVTKEVLITALVSSGGVIAYNKSFEKFYENVSYYINRQNETMPESKGDIAPDSDLQQHGLST